MKPIISKVNTAENDRNFIQLIDDLLAIDELEKLLCKIIDTAPKLVDGAGCSVYLHPGFVDQYTGDLMDPQNNPVSAAMLGKKFMVLAATSRLDAKAMIGKHFYLEGEGLTGWIFKHRKSLCLKNALDTEELNKYEGLTWTDKFDGSVAYYGKKRDGVPRPFLGVPIITNNQECVGVIKIPAKQGLSRFAATAEGTLNTFAKFVANMVEKVRILQVQKVKLESQNATIQRILTIGESRDRQQVWDDLLEQAARLINWKDGGLYLLEESGERMKLVSAQGEFMKEKLHSERAQTYERGQGLSGWVFKTGKPLLIEDITEFENGKVLSDEDLERLSDGPEINESDRKLTWLDKDGEYRNNPTPHFLAMPILDEDRQSVLGVIRLTNVCEMEMLGHYHNPLSRANIDLLKSFAENVRFFLLYERQKRLNELLIQMTTILDAKELFKTVVEKLPKLELGKYCSIFLTDRDKNNTLNLRYTSSPQLLQPDDVRHQKTVELTYRFGEGKTGFVAQSRLSLVINYFGEGNLDHKRLEEEFTVLQNDPLNLVSFLRNDKQEKVGIIWCHGRNQDEIEENRERFLVFADQHVFTSIIKIDDRLTGLAGLLSPKHAFCETYPNDTISFMAVPIKDSENNVLGVIRIPRTAQGGKFSSKDLSLVESIATRLTLTLNQLDLFRRNRETTNQFARVALVSTEIMGGMSSMSQASALERIARHAADLLRAEVCSIWLIKRPGYLSYEVGYGLRPQTEPTRDLQIIDGIKTGLTGAIAARGNILRLAGETLRSDPAVTNHGLQPHLPSRFCYSLLAIPLFQIIESDKKELIGLLKIENKIGEDDKAHPHLCFIEDDERIASILAAMIASSLENSRNIKKLTALQTLGNTLSTMLDLSEIQKTALKSITENLGFEYAIISLVDEKKKIIAATHGIWNGQFDVLPELIDRLTFPLTHSNIYTSVISSKTHEILDSWDERLDYDVWNQFAQDAFLRIFMPISVQD